VKRLKERLAVSKIEHMFDPTTSLHQGLGGAADVSAATGDDLMAEAISLERLRTLLDARSLRVLGELDARGTCDLEEGLSTKGWLARETATSTLAAKRRVLAAKAVRIHLQPLDDALRDGRIGFEHVDVIVRAANPRIVALFRPFLAALITAAGLTSFTAWKSLVEQTARRLDQDGGFDPQREVTSNKLTRSVGLDGLVTITLTLTSANAELVLHAIEDQADELFRLHNADAETCGDDLPVPERTTLEALAVVELVRRGQAVDVDSATPARPEVTLLVPVDEVRPDGGPVVYGRDGVRLPDGSVDHLLDDADFYAIVVNSLGVPVDSGRRLRFASANARRALRIRDGGCIFPGCTNPVAWCDAHHVEEWITGGQTDVSNLASLCRHHHGVVHRTGWSMVALGDGYFEITTPKGRCLETQRHHRRRTPEERARARQRRRRSGEPQAA